MKYNICFFTASMDYAGATKMLCFVAEELKKRGNDVSIINFYTVDLYKGERKVKNDINVFSVKPVGLKGFKRIHQLKEAVKIVKKNKFDVLIGFTMYPNIYATIVGKLLHIPSIVSERGDPKKTFSDNMMSQLIFKVVNMADGAVFQTEGARGQYKSKLQKRGIAIANPISLENDIPICLEKNRKIVMSIGRLDNFQKRYDVMIEAFALFIKSHSEYELWIYGNGPDEGIIKDMITEYDLNDKVILKGLTSSPITDLAKAKMFIITSDYEGISNSLLEAMATGLPCVSTDHTPGGARMLITDHYDGLLAPVGDAPAICRCLSEFADNKELASFCGENAKNVLHRFSKDNIIDQWETYINKVISGGNNVRKT